MPKWQYIKGLHDIGGNNYAYLQPDGGWGWSNAGLIVDGDQNLLVDTLFDLKLTQGMLDTMRDAVPAAKSIKTLVNTHANGDHTFGNQLVNGAEIITTRETAEEMLERPPEGLKEIPADRLPGLADVEFVLVPRRGADAALVEALSSLIAVRIAPQPGS